MNVPRGIRNNNPGNIRLSSDAWQGLAADQKDDEFFTFSEPKWGIRAMVRILQVYSEVHKKRTLSEIISRWAPPGENETGSYIKGLQTLTGLPADEPLNIADYQTVLLLVRGIVRWENGKPEGDDWYEQTVYERGLRLAGLTPGKPLNQSRVIKGTATAGAASAVAGTTLLTQMLGLSPEVAALMPDALASLSAQQVAWLTIFVAVAGNLYAAWARRDDQRMGRL